MSSSLRVNTIVPSSGNNVAIGTAGGSVLFTVNSFDVTTSLIPPGAVQFFARNTAPDGWIKANGANISRSTYSALFAGIGTAFGNGDGSTTFGLPDMRGEFPRGWDDGRGIDSGRVFGAAQAATRIGHMAAFGGDLDISDADALISITRSKYSISNNLTDTRNDSRVRPRNIALLACIKY